MTPVFVFGSNLAGRHGKGAALFARENRGAVYGQGVGRQGQSYAIPTKDANLVPLTLEQIAPHVVTFFEYAYDHPGETFELTPVGTGLAGHGVEDVWRMIHESMPFIPPNVLFTKDWLYGLTRSA